MEHLVALNAVLLFSLAVPVVMKYRILPIEGTPYWLFGLLFLALGLNVVVSLYPQVAGKRATHLHLLRRSLLAFVLIVTVVGVTWTAIADRHKTAPEYNVHDIILQQEIAMRFLREGKNPYKETYFGTVMEKFNYDELGKKAVNPALYHFVMPPWYLIFPFSVSVTWGKIAGYFDGRMVLLVSYCILLFALWKLYAGEMFRNLAIIMVSLAPGVIDFFVEGRSDVFALSWLILSLYFFEKKQYLVSSVVFGLAVMSKQTIWFSVPLYIVFMWLRQKYDPKKTLTYLAVTGVVTAVLAAPFVIWDAKAFMTSAVFYLSGGGENSYPVAGYGFGMILWSMGIIKDIHAYYPFVYWQLLFGLPALALSVWWLMKKPSVSRFLIGYAASLLVIWYFSRYFNNSHITYVGTLFTLGMIKQWDESLKTDGHPSLQSG